VEHAGPGRPTPPIDFEVPLQSIRRRFDRGQVDVDGGLLRRLRGACPDVATDDESCLEAGRDWWPLAIHWALAGEVPSRAGAVARPRSAAEVCEVLRICDEALVPVTPVAGRSGVCGASVPAFGGVALDMCGLSGILEVDSDSLLVDVAPGTFGDVLEAELRAGRGFTLGHWPQSVSLSTVGGWLACRSAGQYSTRYGKIEDMVVGLEVALADGRLIRTGGGAPRAAVGPDLTQLFVGSEGTLGVITRARLRVHPVPPFESRAAYGFGDFLSGLDACRRILRRGAQPAVLRLYDATESARSFATEGRHVLIVLDEGDRRLVESAMAVVDEECGDAGVLDDALVGSWLEHRNDVSALAAVSRRGIVVDTAEVAARWGALPRVYRDTLDALAAVDGTLVASAHQSHAYTDGACLYFTFAGRAPDGADAAWKDGYYRRAWDAITSVTLAQGGAISHHHGIGINRARFMGQALGPTHAVLASLKAVLDPNGILNPGKLGLPSPFGEVPWP
jgi:alkyldihydroxyacetonephosphate synthase